ncbi:GntR family transcriptional regulator [Nocardioides sp. AX2bis]|uniref:GntR family transcriptional regulator n=1 Tax=Nocardioides sp. AX2bis TaxID=2653157 RepID=UPI0012F080C8|nr:GntR family transcriptional regulator [Nocardioides sp. AX2bis]VXC03052.1 DNA-binding transcriptional regulator, GntR family [Nocardioides sp. AX2bis]
MTVDRRLLPPPGLADRAADAIRAMILGGEVGPGERLVESRLTEQLGVSRPPVREALQQLEHEGLVVPSGRRGLAVRTLTRRDVDEIVTLRDALEQLAVRLALPVTDEARLAPLVEALASLEDAGAQGLGAAALVERGFAFHLALVSLSGHQRLIASYRDLGLQVRLCMSANVASRTHEDPTGNAARHRLLLDVVRAGDLDAALAALADHGHWSLLSRFADELPEGSRESGA